MEDSYNKKETAVAKFLVWMKHQILDPITAAKLKAMKINISQCLQYQQQRPQICQDLPGSKSGSSGYVQPQLNEKSMAFGTYIPPDIPSVVGLNDVIGRCSKPFEKQLTSSDVRPDQSRLTMSKADVERCILPLLNREENPCHGIKVKTYDIQGAEYDMTFKIWASKIYVLTTGWKVFYMNHGLLEHVDFVTIWMFRNLSTNKPCFVISSRRLPIYQPIKR